jgi:hypothetical protein
MPSLASKTLKEYSAPTSVLMTFLLAPNIIVYYFYDY